MRKQARKTAGAICGISLAMAGFSMNASAQLNPSDPSIINLYRLNEATSGQVNNSSAGQFLDTANPTPPSVAQNHNDFNDFASDGPAWGTGATFMSGATVVGDGIGLTFTRSDNDHSRLQTLFNAAEGNFSNGKSYSMLFRINPASLADGNLYVLAGNSSNYVALEGVSEGGARVNARVREGAGGGETSWLFNTYGSAADDSNVANARVFAGNWYNVFLSYDANASITLAIDDGTTFQYRKTTTVPADFDTLTHGYADSGVSLGLATYSVGEFPVGPFDGSMESMVMWDKALSVAEMQAIGLTNVPEPASLGVLGIAAMAGLRRRK